jgi:hypothetical protein
MPRIMGGVWIGWKPSKGRKGKRVSLRSAGVRVDPAELAAVTEEEPSFATGVLQVLKSLEETGTGLRIKSMKSGEPRESSVPAAGLSVLEHHRAQQESDRAMYGTGCEDHKLIFCRPDSAYYRPDPMSVRVTRFARASQLISSGTSITAGADRLGHANPSIKLSIYSHAPPADASAEAEVWNTAMAKMIQTQRKARPSRMLANVSGKNAKSTEVAEKKAS